MRGRATGLAAFGAAMALAPAAQAGIDEVHLGVMAHNICVTDCKNADKESGPNLEFQVSFELAGLSGLGRRAAALFDGVG